MPNKDPIVIVAAKRTPLGSFNGYFKTTKCTALAAATIKACLSQAALDPSHVDEVLMGCVLTAGLGQAPARQAALAAGLHASTPCTTVNKMCGSGMKTIMQAHDALLSGTNQVMVAGGMENMSLAPYLLPKARFGYRMGHSEALDHMMLDGLEDAYQERCSMGVFAEACAEKYHFTRQQQDEYALSSLKRAQQATQSGFFKEEITPVSVSSKKGHTTYDTDEGPGQIKSEKIPELKPAFKANGTVTAANASSISDGAAAVLLMRQSTASQLNCQPLATIIGQTSHAQAPEWFTTAPIAAIKTLFDKTGWSAADVDLFEINEAFAVVTMAAISDLHLDREKVNVNGGACALGHPIGASGTRIVVSLINALRQRQLKRGIAALCIGGGEATAIAIEIN
jgi:acetyl-CoA C-acetyltransferase